MNGKNYDDYGGRPNCMECADESLKCTCGKMAPMVPLSELQEALCSEGAKDAAIDRLEKALDWAMCIVIDSYDGAECPKEIYDELEASRQRIVAAGSPPSAGEPRG